MRKIFEIISGLSKLQMRRFEDWLSSPFFNKQENLIALWAYLKDFWPELEHQKLEDTVVFALIFGHKSSFDAARLNHLYSYLLEQLGAYLAWESATTDKFWLRGQTIRQFRRQGLSPKHLQYLLRRQKEEIEQDDKRDATHYFRSYEFYEEQDALFLTAPTRSQDPNLQLKSDYLDYFYIYSKLKIACDMVSRNIVINADFHCELLPQIQDYLRQNPQLNEMPGILLYSLILEMLRSGKAEDYQALKMKLETEITYFSKEEALLLYDYAQNYCIRRINSGETDYYQEFLDLYKTQLSAGILLRNGFLEEWDYKNIVTAGVRIGDYDWTEHFIEENKNYLKPELRENAYIYNLANLYYETARYKEALRLLHQVEFTDPSYHLGAKIIQLKSYYETQEWTAFEALVRAYREYVRRSKQLSDYRKEANLNFLKLAQKIGKYREEADYASDARCEKMLQQLLSLQKELSPLANSDWLEGILEEIMDRQI